MSTGPASMGKASSVDKWQSMQKEFDYTYSYGTIQSQHLSFYSLKGLDYVPIHCVRNKHFGYVEEKEINGVIHVVPISSIDGVLSFREFKIISPSISDSKLIPIVNNIKDFTDETYVAIKNRFANVTDENERLFKDGKKRLCGFDHITYLVEY